MENDASNDDRPSQQQGDNPYQAPQQFGEDATSFQRSNWLRWFRIGFLCWGIFPMLVTVLMVAVGQNPGVILLLTAAWWVVGIRLYLNGKAAFFIALSMVGVFWLIAAWQTIGRIRFVIENRGMERADGLGSPAAFLLGVAWEQCFLFIPMSILLGLGIGAILSSGR